MMQTGSHANPRAMVLAGDGINGELETAEALRLAGFRSEVHSIYDLIKNQYNLDKLSQNFAVLVLPGGFSFGDDLGSGKVLALKLHYALKWNLNQFADRGGMVMGISNGFQTLIRMGVFGRDLSITHNQNGKFVNQWVRVLPRATRSVWLKGVGQLDLPIRHGEGRIVFSPGNAQETLDRLDRFGMMCLKYEINPNGSAESLAGLSDSSGRILGLMPHPEAFVRWTAHPEWTLFPERAAAPGQGLQIFENARKEFR